MSIEKYDAIVVGLGPGGATCALNLAKRGIKTLAIDKAIFPREKICGGCIPRRILEILPFPIEELDRYEVRKVSVQYKDELEISHDYGRPIAHIIDRLYFDHRLVQESIRFGVNIKEGCQLKGLFLSRENIRIETSIGTYETRFLIAADGARSLVRHKLIPHKNVDYYIAIELHIHSLNRKRFRVQNEKLVRLVFGTVPFGYGWVFPRKNGVSIGIATLPRFKINLKNILKNFLNDQKDILSEVKNEIEFNPRARLIPFRGMLSWRPYQGRVVFVGDAAALTDPFLGEGIYYAMKSGIWAADAVYKSLLSNRLGYLEEYYLNIKKEFLPEFREARLWASLFYKNMKYCMKIFLREPGIFGIGANLLELSPEYSRLKYIVLKNALKRFI